MATKEKTTNMLETSGLTHIYDYAIANHFSMQWHNVEDFVLRSNLQNVSFLLLQLIKFNITIINKCNLICIYCLYNKEALKCSLYTRCPFYRKHSFKLVWYLVAIITRDIFFGLRYDARFRAKSHIVGYDF